MELWVVPPSMLVPQAPASGLLIVHIGSFETTENTESTEEAVLSLWISGPQVETRTANESFGRLDGTPSMRLTFYRMSKSLKITLWVVGSLGAIFLALIGIGFVQLFLGIDASEEDPTELFRAYVAKELPASVTVQSAAGKAKPMGTSLTFRFKISATDFDALVAAKKMSKRDSPGRDDKQDMKGPEEWWTDKDLSWSPIPTSAKVEYYRSLGLAVYEIFSP